MLPQPASRAPFLYGGQGANGTGAGVCVEGPGGPVFDGFWHSISGQTPSAKREIGSVSESNRQGRRQEALPIRKYWASAPSSWSVASIWRPGSRSMGLVAVADPHAWMP